jgi:hypothetical protein
MGMCNLKAEFVMSKAPSYSNEVNRTRFQRRIPEDVRHAFNGQEWIRIPLDFPTEREVKRSPLAWFMIYEEGFAGIRYVAEFGKRLVHSTSLLSPLASSRKQICKP